MPKEDRKFRLLNLNRVLLWGNDFRGEGSGNEDNFLNADCCAGPRFQAGKVPPLSPASSSFSGHQVLHSTTRQTGKQCIFDSSGNPPTGRSGIATGEGDGSRAGFALDAVTLTAAASSGGGHSADRGGGYGAAASSGSRLIRVLGGGHSADRTDTSGAAASSGLGLLRVLSGGHSAEHGGGASGAGIAACSSGFERLRRQACCNFRDLVNGFDSLSSHHVDRVRPRGVCGDGLTNSCCDTHGARANACSTLHDARGNSGEHVNSGGCTYNLCGGVRGGTKPRSMRTRDQVRCPAVEKLASLQQAPGRLHVETWAGRNKNSNLPISQVVEILPGCADMVTCLLPPFFSSVSPGPGREVRNGMGWSLLEKTARSGVWLFRGALRGNSAFFAFAAFVTWVKKGSFLTTWAVLPTFLMHLFTCVWARHGCRTTIWEAVLATA